MKATIRSLAPTMDYLSQRAMQLGIDLAFQIHCTLSSQPSLEDPPSCMTIHLSRPSLQDLVSTQISSYSTPASIEATAGLAGSQPDQGIAVIACGPESLVQETRGVVARLSLREKMRCGGVTFHGESYAL